MSPGQYKEKLEAHRQQRQLLAALLPEKSEAMRVLINTVGVWLLVYLLLMMVFGLVALRMILGAI